ncbi:MAG: hypothetical protein J7518_18215 [Nocardioidaceae bacterium]|nr:hypothetical protein [Nocardioidaceae bacterium]
METLRDFLLERIQEEETLAQAAIDAHGIGHVWRGAEDDADGEHFARWNPWRVLASCVSKRLIIAAHRDIGVGVDGRADDEIKEQACSTCGQYDQYAIAWPCYTLRVLALDWADHPSYRREWRPQRLSSGVGRAPATSTSTPPSTTTSTGTSTPTAPPPAAAPAQAPAPAAAPPALPRRESGAA